METIAQLSSTEREELFAETATKNGISPAIIEKDFWVCWTLKRIFEDPTLSTLLMFKGGTSLSKVFNLIERFSEDIDMILDWTVVTSRDPLEQQSKTKQGKLNKEINSLAITFIEDELLPLIKKAIDPICSCSVDVENRHNINIEYPAAFSDKYLRPEVLLEIGPLASWLPYERYSISPYAAEAFPNVFNDSVCKVNAIKAERTFWEKATILHHEAHRPDDNPQPSRYSRHYYDMYMMANSGVKEIALNNLDILNDVVEFKRRFYSRGWANYNLAKPGTLKLIPGDLILENLKTDYKAMENMIFGGYPSFDEIINTIRKLEQEINNIPRSQKNKN